MFQVCKVSYYLLQTIRVLLNCCIIPNVVDKKEDHMRLKKEINALVKNDNEKKCFT